MKKHTSGIRAASGILAATVAMSAASAGAFDWKKTMTVADRKRDVKGNLLPLQSYDETIRRGMAFLLKDHLKWFKGPADTLVDERGKTQMPWVYYSNLQHNGAPFPRSVDRFVSYPAFHHSSMIRTLVGYWRYAKDGRALTEAMKLADWDIAHSTPADWAYSNLPYSTFQEKKPGGFRDKTGLMPDKAAIMGLAYLQLHQATGKARFLRAAEAIGRTLSRRQRPNGTWPFRVDPKTEKVIEEYTSSVIYAVMLFESLDKINGNTRYRANRDLTWKWLLNGPIKTKEFRGFYEDIPASTKGRTNYDCLDTIRYLLANRTKENGYLEIAKDLNAWVEKIFLDKIKGFKPAEGIREQLQCNVVMGIHSLNWASMLMELSKATGDEKMRQRAIQTANYITYYLQPDNRIVVGFRYHQWWYSCHTGVILYLLDFLVDTEAAKKEKKRSEKPVQPPPPPVDMSAKKADPAVQKLAREVATRGWILFDAITERGDRDLFLARPDGSRLRNITNTPELSEIGGRFSPDGKKILYRRLPKGKALNHNKWGAWGQLVIANADGSDPIPQGEDGIYPWASWSPDGKQIACLEKRKIRIYDLESKNVAKELPRHGIFIQLYWSPDGKRLCGTANVAGRQWNIIAIDIATGKATLLTRKLNCTPDWFQQDSRRVVYSHRIPGLATRDGWTMLMQATADGKSRTLVYAEKGQHIYCGCTSPDDKYVILTRAPGDGGVNRAMAIIRLTDTPVIAPEYKQLEALYPDARGGAVLHLTNLPPGFEPHWTYADIREK